MSDQPNQPMRVSFNTTIESVPPEGVLVELRVRPQTAQTPSTTPVSVGGITQTVTQAVSTPGVVSNPPASSSIPAASIPTAPPNRNSRVAVVSVRPPQVSNRPPPPYTPRATAHPAPPPPPPPLAPTSTINPAILQGAVTVPRLSTARRSRVPLRGAVAPPRGGSRNPIPVHTSASESEDDALIISSDEDDRRVVPLTTRTRASNSSAASSTHSTAFVSVPAATTASFPAVATATLTVATGTDSEEELWRTARPRLSDATLTLFASVSGNSGPSTSASPSNHHHQAPAATPAASNSNPSNARGTTRGTHNKPTNRHIRLAFQKYRESQRGGGPK